MNDYETDFALEVIDALIRRPEAASFIDPVDVESDFAEDYYRRIKKPIDITTIRTKIATKIYSRSSEWKSDLELLFKNAKSYFGENSYIGYLTLDLEKYAMKLINSEETMTTVDRMNAFGSIQIKFENWVKKSPDKIVSYFDTYSDDDPERILNKSEVNAFIRACSMLPNPKDARALFGIIQYVNPNIYPVSENIIVNLTDVNNLALHIMKFYVEKRFEEEGLEYPTDDD